MSRKMFSVIKREYWTRLRTKGFIIGTLLMPFLMILFMFGFFIFNELVQPESMSYYIVDQSGGLFDDFDQALSDTLSNGNRKYDLIKMDVPAEQAEVTFLEFNEKVLSKEITGYMIFPETIYEKPEYSYFARNVSNYEQQQVFSRTLTRIVTNKRFITAGLPPDVISREQAAGRISINRTQITEGGEVEGQAGQNIAITYILGFLFYIVFLIYGQLVSRSVIEEKSQRITETIVASIKPFELMAGKIIGMCSLGITQLGVIFFFGFMTMNFRETLFAKVSPSSGELLEIMGFISRIELPGIMIFYFFLFFVLGFVLYASLFASVGAMVNTEDEAQMLQFPVMMPIIIQFIIMMSIFQNPDTTSAYWLSMFPPFTPMLMFARYGTMYPQIPDGFYLSIVLLIITSILIVKLASKIYRVGILMYGKRPSIKEVIKWIRYN